MQLKKKQKILPKRKRVKNIDRVKTKPSRKSSKTNQGNKPSKSSQHRKPKEPKKKKEDRKKYLPAQEIIATYMKLKCDICEVQVNTWKELREHFLLAHTRTPYMKCCGTIYDKQRQLADHLLWHKNPEEFKYINLFFFLIVTSFTIPKSILLFQM